jgi:hypothetical protein
MPQNTTELVIAPTSQRHEFTTLTAEQARRLLQAAQGDRLEALYVLAITMDLPPGGGYRVYAAAVGGNGLMKACWCSHSMGDR